MDYTMKQIRWGALLLVFVAGPALAGDWERAADLGLSMNQSSYSDSWAGGEYGSLNWTFNANFTAARSLSERLRSENTLKLSYGQNHGQYEDESGQLAWASPEKSADRIFFESLFKFTLGKAADPYVALTAESQFYDASVPEVARYLNPILLSESAGIGRTLLESENSKLFTRLGFAVRQHMSEDVLDVATGDTERNTVTDGGAEWVTDYERSWGEDMKFVSKLRVFQALFNSKSDELETDDWKTADLAWEGTLSASVAKYVQVNLFFELLYDREVDLRGRFREVLGLGLTYKMF